MSLDQTQDEFIKGSLAMEAARNIHSAYKR